MLANIRVNCPFWPVEMMLQILRFSNLKIKKSVCRYGGVHSLASNVFAATNTKNWLPTLPPDCQFLLVGEVLSPARSVLLRLRRKGRHWRSAHPIPRNSPRRRKLYIVRPVANDRSRSFCRFSSPHTGTPVRGLFWLAARLETEHLKDNI